MQRKASCNRFPRVLLFPEGTTTNGRFLISFQLGAFVPGFPIQPVVIRYPYVHFDQSWGNISLVKLMFQMFTQFHNFMEVEYLPVIQPPQYPNDNVRMFAERTAYAMATALNVVQTSHTYGDMMLLMKAEESKQENPLRFMVELAHRNLGYHISTADALGFLEKFLSMNPDNSGSINFQDFLRALRLKPSSLSEKIFAFVDVNKTGKIDFKQFLLASTKIMKQPLFQHALELSFAKCNTGAYDHISKKGIAEVISLVIPDATHDDVRELLALLDMDGDGRICKHDFFNCLTRNPLLIALFSPLLNDISHSSNGIYWRRWFDNSVHDV